MVNIDTLIEALCPEYSPVGLQSGKTGYLDIWDKTYQIGTHGWDEHGRRYLITPPMIVECRTKYRQVDLEIVMCIFERYIGSGRLVSTARVLGSNDPEDRRRHDPVPSLFTQEDIQAVASLPSGKLVDFPAWNPGEYSVRLKDVH